MSGEGEEQQSGCDADPAAAGRVESNDEQAQEPRVQGVQEDRRKVIRRRPEAKERVAGVVGEHHQRADEAADEQREADADRMRGVDEDEEFPVVGDERHAQRAGVERQAGRDEQDRAEDEKSRAGDARCRDGHCPSHP